MLRLVLCFVLASSAVSNAAAQTPLFVVRHAERADTQGGTPAMMTTDPPLSAAGRVRAESLSLLLRDAGIRAIYVTEYRRTQETAAPLAKALGLTPVVISSKDRQSLVARLKQGSEPALVVGHSNTVPEVLNALGVTTPITIADTEYDNLFIVTSGSPLIRLRYR
jgi:phosphohistidine phosphatase SixA